VTVVPVFCAIVPANEPVDPSNVIVGYPFNPVDDQTVLPAFPIEVPLKPLSDLSFHALTLYAELKVRLVSSAASNHNARPGILCGENAEYALLVPRIAGIGYLV
jgi:hypothetical protein